MNLPRIIILTADINSFIHVAVRSTVITRPFHGDGENMSLLTSQWIGARPGRLMTGALYNSLCTAFPRTVGASFTDAGQRSRLRPAWEHPQ